MPFTLNEFDILRFKLSKLLQVKEKRILNIKLKDNLMVDVVCLPFGLVSFESIKEIENDFSKFYPNEVIPNRLTLVSAENTDDSCKPSVLVSKD